MTKCLLLKTKENKYFFTSPKNLTLLIEFAKTFNAELILVKTENPKLLTMEELASNLCSPPNQIKPKYEVIEQKLKKQNIIVQKVYDLFIKYKEVSIKDLQKQLDLSPSSIYKILSQVKRQLEDYGYVFSKISAGRYGIQ